MKDIIPFLKQKWSETNKLKMFESVISGLLFCGVILTWLNIIFIPVDDYLKIHTLENTDHIVIYSMLGFIITSIIAGLYLLRYAEYFIIKSSLICYKLYKENISD